MSDPCPICTHPLPENPVLRKQRAGVELCSTACAREFLRQRTGHHGLGLPSATIGAMSEYVVALDLLRQGYEVFRAMSNSAECDLAILKHQQLLRVEVRTAAGLRVDGSWCAYTRRTEHVRYDILAAVRWLTNGSHEIRYDPPLVPTAARLDVRHSRDARLTAKGGA